MPQRSIVRALPPASLSPVVSLSLLVALQSASAQTTGVPGEGQISGSPSGGVTALATVITVGGNGNRVTRQRAARGKRPAISVSGNGDRVSQH